MAYRWYIVHALSGYEEKVASAIQEQSQKKGLSDLFGDIVVPAEEVAEVRRGKKVNVKRKFLPGYILVNMQLTDETWHLVKSVPRVSGFLGNHGKPQPVSEAEAQRIIKQVEEGTVVKEALVEFEVGESVKVLDGPFESFIGVVDELDSERNRLKVAVSIFGRSTPVELEYSQVSKIED